MTETQATAKKIALATGHRAHPALDRPGKATSRSSVEVLHRSPSGRQRPTATIATAAQLNDYIQHLNGWAGINGYYNFTTGNQRGLGIDAVVMDRWDPAAGDFVLVSKGGGAIK